MPNEKNNKAWKVFKNKMIDLKRRQSEILVRIIKKLDQQKIDNIMKKLKKQ